jgi:hypothetical protein
MFERRYSVLDAANGVARPDGVDQSDDGDDRSGQHHKH